MPPTRACRTQPRALSIRISDCRQCPSVLDLAHQFGQSFEAVHGVGQARAEVDQTRDLVDPDLSESFDYVSAVLRRAEQAGLVEVTVEGATHREADLPFAELARVLDAARSGRCAYAEVE